MIADSRSQWPLKKSLIFAAALSLGWGVFFFLRRSLGFDQYDVVGYYWSMTSRQPQRPALGFGVIDIQLLLAKIVPAQLALVLPSVVAGSLQTGILYLIGRRALRSELLGLLVSTLATVLSVSLIYSTIGMTDIIQSAIALTCFWIFYEAYLSPQDQKKSWLVAGAFAFGLLFGVKSTQALCFPSLLFLHWLSRDRSVVTMIRDIPVMAVAFFSAVAFWLVPAYLMLNNLGEANNAWWLFNQISQFNVLNISLLEKVTGASVRLALPIEHWQVFFYVAMMVAGFCWMFEALKSHAFNIFGFISQLIFLILLLMAFQGNSNLYGLHGTHTLFWRTVVALFVIVFCVCMYGWTRAGTRKIKCDWEQFALLAYFIPYLSFFLLLVGSVPRYYLPIYCVFVLGLVRPVVANVGSPGLEKFKTSCLVVVSLFLIALIGQHCLPMFIQMSSEIDSRSGLFKMVSEASTSQLPSTLYDASSPGRALEIYRHTIDNQYVTYDRIEDFSKIPNLCNPQRTVFVSTEGFRTVNCVPEKGIELVKLFTRNEFTIEDSVSNEGFSLWKVNCGVVQSCKN